MRRALELAARGRCGCSPNPMVGAVLLDRDGHLAGEGYHRAFGGPHAEIEALAAAGDRARGGTLFVTLEPCSHHGKTPPCVDAIVAAGVGKVVVAMRDPTEDAGGGVERLRGHGVEVETAGATEARLARALNRRWLRMAEVGRPWVSLKAAVSLDGRVATRDGQSKWVTGAAARRRGLELREEHDAILVGVETVLADDPRLTRRLGLNPVRSTWRRVVLDSRLRTPSDAVVLSLVEEQPTWLVHTPLAADPDRRRLRDAGAQLIEVPAREDGRVALEPLARELAERGVAALLVEGGPTVHGSWVDAGLVDEVFLFMAPMLIGGPAPVAVAGAGVSELRLAPRFRFEDVTVLDDDVELHAVAPEDACSPA